MDELAMMSAQVSGASVLIDQGLSSMANGFRAAWMESG